MGYAQFVCYQEYPLAGESSGQVGMNILDLPIPDRDASDPQLLARWASKQTVRLMEQQGSHYCQLWEVHH